MALVGGVWTALDITAHFAAGGGRSQSLAANGNRHLPVGRRSSHSLQDPTSHFCTAFPSNQRGLSYNTEKTSMCFGTVIDLNPDVKPFSTSPGLPGDRAQDRPRSRLTRMQASKRKKTKRHNSNPNFGNEPDASLNGRAAPRGRGSRANPPSDSELLQPSADPQMNIREAVLQLKTEQQNLRLVSEEPSTRPAWEVGAPSSRNGSSNSITLIQRTIRGGQTEDHPGTIVVSSGFFHSLSPNVDIFRTLLETHGCWHYSCRSPDLNANTLSGDLHPPQELGLAALLMHRDCVIHTNRLDLVPNRLPLVSSPVLLWYPLNPNVPSIHITIGSNLGMSSISCMD
jgi:hypothetical protein